MRSCAGAIGFRLQTLPHRFDLRGQVAQLVARCDRQHRIVAALGDTRHGLTHPYQRPNDEGCDCQRDSQEQGQGGDDDHDQDIVAVSGTGRGDLSRRLACDYPPVRQGEIRQRAPNAGECARRISVVVYPTEERQGAMNLGREARYRGSGGWRRATALRRPRRGSCRRRYSCRPRAGCWCRPTRPRSSVVPSAAPWRPRAGAPRPGRCRDPGCASAYP